MSSCTMKKEKNRYAVLKSEKYIILEKKSHAGVPLKNSRY